MPKTTRQLVVSLAVAASAVVASPAAAERPISGAEAQRLLTGKQFLIQCVDGTQGYGAFNQHGGVNVAYRRFNATRDTPDMRDRATVRIRGHEICLAWKEFDGGGDGCYPVAEMDNNHFRIGSGLRWCEIKARP